MLMAGSVAGRSLCHGCGICAAVCPADAIAMVCKHPGIFVPEHDEAKCVDCKKCVAVCSGKEPFGDRSLLGDVAGVWIGHAADEEVRVNGSSGGVVSAILIHLLETKAIDAAVICKPDEKFPARGMSLAAKTRDDILRGAKSIYGMTEIGSGLKEALDDSRVKKIAVVGLPCQIASLRQATEVVAEIGAKVFLSIGLMCGHNVYHKATSLAIKGQGIRMEDVAEFRYRASGWSPWFIEIITKKGKRYTVCWEDSPFAAIWDALVMVPRRCLLCNDFAAEAADIAVGDAWLAEYKGNQKGYSIILAHTRHGAGVVQNLADSKCLDLKLSDAGVIGRSQYCQLDFKKRSIAARSKLLGRSKWFAGKGLGNLSIEDYLIEIMGIGKNRIGGIMVSLNGKLFFLNRLVSYLTKKFLRFTLMCCDRMPHGKSIVWRSRVRFGPDMLAGKAETVSSQSPAAEDGGNETM